MTPEENSERFEEAIAGLRRCYAEEARLIGETRRRGIETRARALQLKLNNQRIIREFEFETSGTFGAFEETHCAGEGGEKETMSGIFKKVISFIDEWFVETFLPKPLSEQEGWCDKYDTKPYVDSDDVR